MRVKQGSNVFLFIDILYICISIFIVSLAYFLGYDITTRGMLIYLGIVLSIVLVGIMVFLLYLLLCKKYIVFDDEKITIVHNGEIKKTVYYNKVFYSEHYSIFHLLLLSSCGGCVFITYFEGYEQKQLEFAISKQKISLVKDHLRVKFL